MASIFHSHTSSYASEQLQSQLSALSTLPITFPPSTQLHVQQSTTPKPHLQSALSELSSSKPISKERLQQILEDLSSAKEQEGYATEQLSEIDELVEVEVMGRAVTVLWKEVLDAFIDGALNLERERVWWDSVLNSRRGVSVYLIQTMPHRLWNALPPRAQLSFPDLKTFKFPSKELLFKPLHSTTSAALTSITSPWTLTRREILSTRSELTHARDNAAHRIGVLASQGPQWSVEAKEGVQATGDVASETQRVYSLLCSVLDVPLPKPRRSRSATPPHSIPTASTLLSLLTTHLSQSQANISSILSVHARPGRFTRLWFPFLFLPPTLYFTVSIIGRNKEWLQEQIKNGKETIKGFFVQWVWEPLEGIGKTLRGGGEGLGVAPSTVRSDQASLERMVMDLGKDYYHLSGPQLQALGDKVKNGDMEEVLRVYEREMQSPLKNALMGSLVRTLLIQVQKTKTDLSLSLLSLDHLLRSQQLTFAFVGLAPSLLILYGFGGWLQGVWKGEKRGKSRRQAYFHSLRSIERLLITSPEAEMTHRDRGLLIISVSSLRSWAIVLGASKREAFLDDLRMVEDPVLKREDKLRVVERIWRCWGVDGRGKAYSG
ncbi:hypothetical protein CNAG_04746 [Cryptococcus neoformans var. grubii H99]|uniref:ATP synthase regulation protein NCA2 n=1 Tax=Cryptococcus neoformans (strain H99 / ATCC 208821 / CBS 10515 / FGSC 9487) TaxID=235443 RepID=J9VTA3_CRYN9|nr:hypothetical protein CNAG_04746 [Cryptococcus neoformans var. grubii H99]AFR97473.1 hypothetical protein CNAG_04746 [Cryptococcus neoformans var. grubii H99]AUB27500.1 hypothetical protein CKF44_04746 [Cryptococcus neoformans var. grubii]|eukprot:XP_012052180.1 hypothetical protein CNAG_04746 [Cryptococcus neoformans var. grubii H99]